MIELLSALLGLSISVNVAQALERRRRVRELEARCDDWYLDYWSQYNAHKRTFEALQLLRKLTEKWKGYEP